MPPAQHAGHPSNPFCLKGVMCTFRLVDFRPIRQKEVIAKLESRTAFLTGNFQFCK